MRADLARMGWSAQADIGDRLRYVDAMALVGSMLTDPATSLGARLMGFRYPCSVPDLVSLLAMGGRALKGTSFYPLMSESEVRRREGFKGTRAEVAEAKTHMAGIFSSL